MRAAVCPDVSVMADVFVKHATAPAGLSLVDATRDLVERSGADAVIVSGVGTGSAADVDDLGIVAGESALPVFVGSGVSTDNARQMLGLADGAIVGSSIKVDGVATNRVDLAAATAFVAAAT